MATQRYKLDPVHSSIEFAVTYAMNSIVKGRFTDFNGSIALDPDAPEESSTTVEIRAGSITTDAEPRDQHLRGDDFFDVANHATLAFESTDIEVVEAHRWQINGNLTIIGVTKPVTLDAHFYGIVDDARGSARAGFVAEVDLTRSNWGLTWNAKQPDGVLVSDRVRVSLYISAVPDDSEQPDNDTSEDDRPDTTELS